jgi:hypothetical protein
MQDETGQVEQQRPKRGRVNPWLIVALVAAIAAGVLLASSVWDERWNSRDNASANEVAEEAKRPDPQSWCASQATYDSIKRELFRRAAQARGSDEQAFARLADFALLRVNGPIVRGIDDRVNSVSCSGTAVLSLPPGVSVGGSRSLSGDLDYMIQPAADGTGNVIRLGNVDSIVVRLATISRTAPAAAPAVPQDLTNTVGEEEPANEGDQTSQEQSRVTPSFDCGKARSRSEIAICNDPGLAALDRQMAAQFNSALIEADRAQRGLLERTRSRFLSFRDRCATNQCIADTYRSRMREIGDILNDRWRG